MTMDDRFGEAGVGSIAPTSTPLQLQDRESNREKPRDFRIQSVIAKTDEIGVTSRQDADDLARGSYDDGAGVSVLSSWAEPGTSREAPSPSESSESHCQLSPGEEVSRNMKKCDKTVFERQFNSTVQIGGTVFRLSDSIPPPTHYLSDLSHYRALCAAREELSLRYAERTQLPLPHQTPTRTSHDMECCARSSTPPSASADSRLIWPYSGTVGYDLEKTISSLYQRLPVEVVLPHPVPVPIPVSASASARSVYHRQGVLLMPSSIAATTTPWSWQRLSASSYLNTIPPQSRTVSSSLKFGMDRILSGDISLTLDSSRENVPQSLGGGDSRFSGSTNLLSASTSRADQCVAPSQSSNKRKRSWSRAVFSNLQRKGLEKRFQMQKYITKPDRRQLAATLGLTDAQVKVWFQNRRMKWRHTKEPRFVESQNVKRLDNNTDGIKYR